MSQDVLFTEDFETGGSFDLNTADEGGLSAGSSPNQWIVNSSLVGLFEGQKVIPEQKNQSSNVF